MYVHSLHYRFLIEGCDKVAMCGSDWLLVGYHLTASWSGRAVGSTELWWHVGIPGESERMPKRSAHIDAEDVAQVFGESESKALSTRGSDAWGLTAAPGTERFSSPAWALMIARSGR